jgi:hypothetical protein
MAIATSVAAHVERAIPSPRIAVEEEDAAFRRLLGEAHWRALAPAVRARFGVKPRVGETVRYRGIMAEVRASRLGRLFARLCRLIGSPLAPHTGRDVPITVLVYRDGQNDGVVWRREYSFPGRGRTIAQSVKRVDGTDGLLECFARGVVMRMRVFARDGALHFLSTGYFIRLGRRRLPIPALVTPGRTHVVHADRGNGVFSFTLSVRHPLYGETFFQDGLFHAR